MAADANSAGQEVPSPSSKRIQTAAVALLLHGLIPLAFGGEQSALTVVLGLNACLYVLLAWALWHGKRLALWTALILTTPQVFAIGSSWFAWESYAGLRFGFYIEPRFNPLLAPLAVYWSVGGALRYGLGRSNDALLAEFYVEDGARTFVVVNFVAALVLLTLVAAKRQQDRHRRLTAAPG